MTNLASEAEEDKTAIPDHFRITLSRLTGDAEWDVISNPRWMSTENACNKILLNAANRYAEYQNCGVVHRMIRVKDAAEYGIDEIKPEWALNPEDAGWEF